MTHDTFCGGCGQKGMQANWRHCPHCGFKVLRASQACMYPVPTKSEQPAGWNPLWVKANDIADDLMAEGYLSTKQPLPSSDWDEAWIEEFKHDHYAVGTKNNESGEPNLALQMVVTSQPRERILAANMPKLDWVEVRLIDDGWYIAISTFDDTYAKAQNLAKQIQAVFGGEILVSKPKADSKKKSGDAQD